MPSRRRPARRRRLWPFVLLAVVAIGIALGILALPFRHAPAHAEAAKTELQVAKDALVGGHNRRAREAIGRAREDADQLQTTVQGFGGDVWSWVPILGGPVNDVRHLGNALDNLTTAAEAGAKVWPMVAGPEMKLVNGGSFDMPALKKVAAQAKVAATSIQTAEAELEAVADSRMIIGARLGEARDEAAAQVAPLADRADRYAPMLDLLPEVVGGSGERTYILALLNPAEMLYSGGTPQTFTAMRYDDGTLTWDDTMDFRTEPWLMKPTYWRKTPGNAFHRGRLKVATSTMAPDWAVAGDELVNAWSAARGEEVAGVIALDVVALADLLEITGPMPLPGVGVITADNLVEELVGSYDKYPDQEERHAINRRLAKTFALAILTGEARATGEILAAAADERRFALYLSDPEEQEAFNALDLSGSLAKPDRDYLGVFTQMRIPSKSDYWQRRAVTSDVRVREDGSARVTLDVQIHNDSPPYLQSYPDPGDHYYTRWSNLSVLTMLPEGARIASGTIDGEPFKVRHGNFYGRVFQRESIEFEPQSTHVLRIEYDVPAAAKVGSDGSLAYGLALDPQGMVTPQAVTVDVRFPEGFSFDAVPEGWQAAGARRATYTSPGLETSESFEITAHP